MEQGNLMEQLKKYWYLVAGAIVGVYFLFFDKKKVRRRRRSRAVSRGRVRARNTGRSRSRGRGRATAAQMRGLRKAWAARRKAKRAKK